MNHYVYYIEHERTKEFYIGSRSCKCIPEKDSYMGSMKVWKPNKDLLRKYILQEFETREKAFNFEIELISRYIKDPLNRNYHIPSIGFSTLGTVTVKDSNGNFYQISNKDPEWLSGNLKTATCGTIVVKDRLGNFYRVEKDDPRYLSGELKDQHNEMVQVIDEFKKIRWISR